MNCNVLTEPWDLRWSVERHVRWATNSNKTILKWNHFCEYALLKDTLTWYEEGLKI